MYEIDFQCCNCFYEYLFGVFTSGWMKRWRGKIMTVGIMLIVIVLLSGEERGSLERICVAGGGRGRQK